MIPFLSFLFYLFISEYFFLFFLLSHFLSLSLRILSLVYILCVPFLLTSSLYYWRFLVGSKSFQRIFIVSNSASRHKANAWTEMMMTMLRVAVAMERAKPNLERYGWHYIVNLNENYWSNSKICDSNGLWNIFMKASHTNTCVKHVVHYPSLQTNMGCHLHYSIVRILRRTSNWPPIICARLRRMLWNCVIFMLFCHA